jgi:putative ABC transport system substrate-binding protein
LPAWRTPGGNVTGFSFVDFPLFGKSLGLLRQIAPKATRIGLMFRPLDHPYYDDYLKAFAADKRILPAVLVHRQAILASAAQHGVPAIHAYRQAVVEDGLMSYGPDTVDIFRRSAAYVDRILKREKPAYLPAQAPIKFELVVNLKTVKALGLDVPQTLLATADEVIE